MGKMVIRRLEGGFELSGGPLKFRHERDLLDMCIQLMRFTRLQYQTDGGPKNIESMMIDDEQILEGIC